MLGGSAHLHAGGQAGAAAPQGKDLGCHKVLQLVFHLVVRQDLLARPLMDDLSHHQPRQAGLPPASDLLPEITLQVSQFYRVFLAAMHPHLSFLKLSRESLEELKVLMKKAFLEVMVVVHEIATNCLGHIHILFELMIIILLSLHFNQIFFHWSFFFMSFSGSFFGMFWLFALVLIAYF